MSQGDDPGQAGGGMVSGSHKGKFTPQFGLDVRLEGQTIAKGISSGDQLLVRQGDKLHSIGGSSDNFPKTILPEPANSSLKERKSSSSDIAEQFNKTHVVPSRLNYSSTSPPSSFKYNLNSKLRVESTEVKQERRCFGSFCNSPVFPNPIPRPEPSPDQNTAPIADPGGPYEGRVGQAIIFDGSGSYDPDGDSLYYFWSFGDGTPGTNESEPTHTYAQPGLYRVFLRVKDDQGGHHVARTSVVISENFPKAILQEDFEETMLMTPEVGGTLEMESLGVHYRLSIPPDALHEPTEISMTPVISIDGLPLTYGMEAAVQLKPEGLRFWRPATLTMTMSEGQMFNDLVGFVFQDEGQGFHLAPIEISENDISKEIWHFSIHGSGGATDSDLAALQDTSGMTWNWDRVDHEISLLDERIKRGELNEDQYWEDVVSILESWESGPGGILERANQIPESPKAFANLVNEWVAWQKYVDTCMGCEHLTIKTYTGVWDIPLTEAITNSNQECLKGNENSEETLIDWLSLAYWMTEMEFFYVTTFNPWDLKTCGFHSIELTPQEKTIEVGELMELVAVPRDIHGNEVTLPTNIQIYWENDNDSVSTLEETDDKLIRLVRGLLPGTNRPTAWVISTGATVTPLGIEFATIGVELNLAGAWNVSGTGHLSACGEFSEINESWPISGTVDIQQHGPNFEAQFPIDGGGFTYWVWQNNRAVECPEVGDITACEPKYVELTGQGEFSGHFNSFNADSAVMTGTGTISTETDLYTFYSESGESNTFHGAGGGLITSSFHVTEDSLHIDFYVDEVGDPCTVSGSVNLTR